VLIWEKEKRRKLLTKTVGTRKVGREKGKLGGNSLPDAVFNWMITYPTKR
jgi:hypothetical protein